MTEEKLKQYLAEGRSNESSPFKVPEGYFDTFCDNVLKQLPAETSAKKPRILLLRQRFWQHAAATLFAIVTIGLALNEAFNNKKQNAPVSVSITQEIVQAYEDDAYVDDALDYAMIENSEIAAYLTGN